MLERLRRRIRRTLRPVPDDSAAARSAGVEELRREVARLERRIELLQNFAVPAQWHALDLIYSTRTPPSRLTCLACGHADEAPAFGKRIDRCMFGGGDLIRHACPRCGCVFGSQKYLELPSGVIDADYRLLYEFYRESDSTEGEMRTFKTLDPAPGGVYLNWGSGVWSGAIDRLRAEGWDVWGFEPNASINHPHVVTRRDQIAGPFDGIFSHNLIEHLSDPAAAFAEFSRLLKPEGRMAHASPCYAWSYPFTRFHVFFPLDLAPEALAERTGFRVSSKIDDGEFRVRIFDRNQTVVR
jgi:SAM-dependent methyltransferase